MTATPAARRTWARTSWADRCRTTGRGPRSSKEMRKACAFARLPRRQTGDSSPGNQNNCIPKLLRRTAVLFLSVALAASAQAGARHPAPNTPVVAVVSHVKVLSDRVEDLSSLEAWKHSFIHRG